MRNNPLVIARSPSAGSGQAPRRSNLKKNRVAFEEAASMKKENKTRTKRMPEMLKEYDFSKGVQGKYAKRYAAGSNVIVLSTDKEVPRLKSRVVD
jgi:hypothetical protein